MAHSPPIGYGVGMGSSGGSLYGMWAVPIGLQGVMAPHIGYEVGMGDSVGSFYGIWAVAVGLHGSHGPPMGCGV